MKQNIISNSLNLFIGIIPPDLGYCQNLTYLDVSSNNLSGDIPSSIGDLRQLQTLYLYANQLTGKLSQTRLLNQALLLHNEDANFFNIDVQGIIIMYIN